MNDSSVKRRRTVAYPNAQCRLLVRAVRHLCDTIRRPVCSKDLDKHFRFHPDERPLLTQAMGQQLFKAARPLSKDRLYRVGIIGNRAYYAADDDEYWRSRFAAHEADLAIERALKEKIPDEMTALPSASALKRNALAGWRLEMERRLELATETFSAQIIKDVLHLGGLNAAPSWTGMQPDDLVSKAEAITMLTNELSLRAPYQLETKINWERHLGPLRWPQTCLFSRPAGAPVYSRRQLQLLAKALWPEPNEDGDVARAELLALRYGMASSLQD